MVDRGYCKTDGAIRTKRVAPPAARPAWFFVRCGIPCESTVMKRFLIERNIPGVGRLNGAELKGASATSNEALAKLAGKVQWVHSYVTDDQTFCIYLADHEASVHEHAQLSGFPASKVTEIRTVIEPMTAMC
jgi:hypothetical protein